MSNPSGTMDVSLSWPYNSITSTSGAISATGNSSTAITNAPASLQPQSSGFTISAQHSNLVYTDKGKVQPLSLSLNYIIKS